MSCKCLHAGDADGAVALRYCLVYLCGESVWLCRVRLSIFVLRFCETYRQVRSDRKCLAATTTIEARGTLTQSSRVEARE